MLLHLIEECFNRSSCSGGAAVEIVYLQVAVSEVNVERLDTADVSEIDALWVVRLGVAGKDGVLSAAWFSDCKNRGPDVCDLKRGGFDC